MPVLPHYTPLFSVDKCSITPMLTDTIGSPGTTTYGTKIDLPGIQTVQVDPDVLSKELFGDNAIAALAAKVRRLIFKLGVAKLSLDTLALIMGGAVVDAGTTPNQTTTYDHRNTDSGKYFKVEYQVLGVEVPGPAGGGDVHFIGWKCKLMSTAVAAKQEDFAPHMFDVIAIARLSDGKDFTVVENETLVAIA